MSHLKLFFFPSFACYHLDTQTMTPAQAEVSCGNLGGRLASFATKDEIDQLAKVLSARSVLTEMWLGKVSENHIIFLGLFITIVVL